MVCGIRLTVTDDEYGMPALSMQLSVNIVLPEMACGTEEESADERAEVPSVSSPESAHVAMLEVDHDTVVLPPLSTRLGLAVRLLMAPANTH